MPQALSDAIRRVRSKVDETTVRFWTDTEITDWINDGLRDIARRAEDLQSFNTSVSAVVGTAKYALPSDVVRVHRVEFVPTGSTQTYPVRPSTYQEMDQVWGINQVQQSSYPSFFVIFGYPGGTGASAHQIQCYPVPAQTGTFNIIYYRLPYRFLDPIANPGELAKSLEVVEGWDDAVVEYAGYQALKKDRNPLWKDMKEEYEEKMQYLIDVTRQWHDQQRFVMTSTMMGQPQWLYEFMDG